jgi:NAD(P)-dependent dehydrogenase (short-subunit alcohol dehydrogenase family)
MAGRVCLITGATSGIGEATARGLARLGATLLIHGRDPDRCQRVTAVIRAESGNPNVDFLVADFTSLTAVRALAEEVVQRAPRLHVLVNNAGAMYPSYRETADGYEATFGVNHLAPFLLTNLLLGALGAGAPSRVINLASGAHRRASLSFEDLYSRHGYAPRDVYARSKLMNMLFTRELASRLQGSGITVNAVSPGIVHTQFGLKDGMGEEQQAVMNRGISPGDGARTSIYLASSVEVSAITGGYYQDCAPAEASEGARDDAAARRLWDLSASLSGLA